MMDPVDEVSLFERQVQMNAVSNMGINSVEEMQENQVLSHTEKMRLRKKIKPMKKLSSSGFVYSDRVFEEGDIRRGPPECTSHKLVNTLAKNLQLLNINTGVNTNLHQKIVQADGKPIMLYFYEIY